MMPDSSASVRRLGGSALFLGLAFAVAALALWALSPASGADHKDAPSISNDRPADITDIYAFRSPANNDNLVVVMPVNPLTAPAENAASTFPTDVTFQLKVDNTGDVTPDATAEIKFSGSNPQMFTVTGLGATPITGEVTPPSGTSTPTEPKITDAGGIKVFAGQRDDPFFFDLVGFQGFVANPQAPVSGLRPAGGGTAVDTFAGTNISAIVIELPITALTGAANSNTGIIKVFGTAVRGGQVDRVAIPAVNTALVPAGQKDAFNQATDPKNDVATFGAGIQGTIEGLRTAVDALFGTPQDGGPLGNLTPQVVTNTVLPYVVTIDFSKPVAFPNGRTLTEDVIDVMLGVGLNRGGAAGVSDGVNASDRQPTSAFPFVAAPHQPAAAASGTATPAAGSLPRTGGSQGDMSTTDFALLGLLAMGAMLMVSGGGLVFAGRKSNN